MRTDGRQADELRPLKIKRRYTRSAPGSVLLSAGNTTVLCCAAVEAEVPAWLKGKGRGWLTAEYSMLPGSTSPRKRRERGANIDGRTTEIQRLIGRSLRAVIDLAAIGERTVTVVCAGLLPLSSERGAELRLCEDGTQGSVRSRSVLRSLRETMDARPAQSGMLRFCPSVASQLRRVVYPGG
jgi:ribonuclease PH